MKLLYPVYVYCGTDLVVLTPVAVSNCPSILAIVLNSFNFFNNCEDAPMGSLCEKVGECGTECGTSTDLNNCCNHEVYRKTAFSSPVLTSQYWQVSSTNGSCAIINNDRTTCLLRQE